MIIRVWGTNTRNKGAELMLNSILDSVEKYNKDAIVEYNMGYEYMPYDEKIETPLKLRLIRNLGRRFLLRTKITGLLRRLKINLPSILPQYISRKDKIDIFFDASGFSYSDQFGTSSYIYQRFEQSFRRLKEKGVFTVMLPQAFGPFASENGKKMAIMLGECADIIFVRDRVSYNYLLESGCDKSKLLLYPDFTSLVKGTVPPQYSNLKGAVGIIPNKRIIDKGNIGAEEYYNFIGSVIKYIQGKNRTAYLLNIESTEDLEICRDINSVLEVKVPVITDVTALEIKGIIAQSYLVISSRFHGVASALNSGTPCLATSWSHKYEELFHDFGQDDCLLDLHNFDNFIAKVSSFMEEENNKRIKHTLLENHRIVAEKNQEMWNLIWTRYEERK